jgi:hypothetical protein
LKDGIQGVIHKSVRLDWHAFDVRSASDSSAKATSREVRVGSRLGRPAPGSLVRSSFNSAVALTSAAYMAVRSASEARCTCAAARNGLHEPSTRALKVHGLEGSRSPGRSWLAFSGVGWCKIHRLWGTILVHTSRSG